MEDYVVPEFYDVLVGGEVYGSQKVIYSNDGFKWDPENGITGVATEINIPAGTWSPAMTFNIYSTDTDETVKIRLESFDRSTLQSYLKYTPEFSNCLV